MSGFEPGEGWREVFEGEEAPGTADLLTLATGSLVRYWVREAPVPPLPTEPYTVIQVAWRSDSARPLGDLGIRTLFPDGTWTGWAAENLLERITGFEVLAEPRAVTAKAVVSWVRDEFGSEIVADSIAREFGVTS